jgi:hypothetical protein
MGAAEVVSVVGATAVEVSSVNKVDVSSLAMNEVANVAEVSCSVGVVSVGVVSADVATDVSADAVELIAEDVLAEADCSVNSIFPKVMKIRTLLTRLAWTCRGKSSS